MAIQPAGPFSARGAEEERTSLGADITSAELVKVDDREVGLALLRFSRFEPFIYRECTADDVLSLSEELGLKRAQVYASIRKLRQVPSPIALIRSKRGVRPGARRLLPEVEALIRKEIEIAHRSGRAININTIHGETETDCHEAGIKAPCIKTVRNRIESSRYELLLRRRLGSRRARERVRALPGTITTEAPLETVEIDHSPLDLFLVSSDDRACIGRAYLTIAIDTFTRCVLGFHLGLDPPSFLTVALTLTHAVTPKDEWLSERGLGDLEWPMFGLMRRLRVDNAAEFRSPKFESACSRWGIEPQFRNKKEDGAIIERLIGTIQNWASQEPGASGSDPKKRRGERDPKCSAQMTLLDAERWLARQLAMRYHLKRHGTLGMSPSQAWRAWNLVGDGRGMSTLLVDKKAFLISFLPSVTRVISHDGIRLFNERYFNNEIRAWIRPKEFRVVHYDPRRLGRIFVELPVGYVEVPYADLRTPCLPKFEVDHRKQLKRNQFPNELDHPARVAYVSANRLARRSSKAATRAARLQERRAQCDRVAATPPTPPKEHQSKAERQFVDYALEPNIGSLGPV